MLIHWILLWLVPGWNDIITDEVTKKVSSRKLFGAIGFFVAIWISAASGIAAIKEGKEPDNLTIGLLLANGLGLAALQGYFSQQNRKTVDPDSGAPLAKPEPKGPDELMGQP
jgi:hypothetical protein